MKKIISISIFCFALISNVMCQIPNYVPSNGLVGWWPFNGNANDLSGNGNNGTVNGPVLSTDRFGQSNKAYSFDGINDFISLPNILPVQVGTISFWFQTNSSNDQILVYHANQNSENGWGTANQNAIEDHTGISFGGASYVFDNGNGTVYYHPTTLILNQWYHMAVAYNNSSAFCYLNGSLIYTMDISSETGNNLPTTTYIGRPNWATRFFSGKFDDLGVWNRVLTSQEISALFTSCQLGTTISQNLTTGNIGSNVSLTASSTLNSTFTWQTNPANNGWQNVNSNNNYSGTSTNTLLVNNVQLANHNQTFRVISTLGNCIDTSNVATIQISDTCINTITVFDTTTVTIYDTTQVTIYDTLNTTVTDTLIINTTLNLPAPNNENSIRIYPNPASDFIFIDNGNYTAMNGYSIKIENNAGQQVFQSTINQAQFIIDLSTWTGDGLYFVHLIDTQGNTVTVRKIVLQ
ncbi:MAG: hypothetical protein RL264_1274 [Bacteroidota bacterium]